MGQALLRATAYTNASRPRLFTITCSRISTNTRHTRSSYTLLNGQQKASGTHVTRLAAVKTLTGRPSTSSSISLLPPMSAFAQIRGHAGHSHSNKSDPYLTSSNKNDAGVRITRIGLFVNLTMAIAKGIGGWLFHSQALIADAFHALTDLVSDFMTLATISWSLKPPSERFPSGYGKIESLGALGVSGILVFGGLGMGLQGLDALYLQFFTDVAAGEHAHGLFPSFGHSHSHGAQLPNINAAWLAGGSIIVKEWLYRATMKIAKERKSSVLASNAVHHRIDSLTSIVALMTIGGAHVLTNAAWLDPVGGILISAMVIKAGWNNTYTSLLELADVTVDNDIKGSVRRSATKALHGDPTQGLQGVKQSEHIEIMDVQGVKSGQNYLMDLELAVPASLTVGELSEIEDAIRDRVGSKVRGVRRVRVKFTTREASRTLKNDFIGADISPRSSPEPEDEHDHDHDHSHSHSHDHSHGNGNGHLTGKDKKMK